LKSDNTLNKIHEIDSLKVSKVSSDDVSYFKETLLKLETPPNLDIKESISIERKKILINNSSSSLLKVSQCSSDKKKLSSSASINNIISPGVRIAFPNINVHPKDTKTKPNLNSNFFLSNAKEILNKSNENKNDQKSYIYQNMEANYNTKKYTTLYNNNLQFESLINFEYIKSFTNLDIQHINLEEIIYKADMCKVYRGKYLKCPVAIKIYNSNKLKEDDLVIFYLPLEIFYIRSKFTNEFETS